MKKGLVLVLGFLLVSAGLLVARGGKSSAVAFTLANSEGGPPGVSFSLAETSAAPAGPGGLGVIEDADWPYRTALGFQALGSNTTAERNTAIGYNALYLNEGSNNTAVGAFALVNTFARASDYNTAIGAGTFGVGGPTIIGSYNTGIGAGAFGGITYGLVDFNTAVGYQAGYKGGTYANTSLGALALRECDMGRGNTAVGYAALENVGSGPADVESYNTAIGFKAGSLAGGLYCDHNIFIGANQMGNMFDRNTIRIGVPFDPGSASSSPTGQNRTFIAGIVETPLTPDLAPAVVGITSEGRLGTFPSELLPKGDPGPMGPAGPQGPAGQGLVKGSLLFLLPNVAPPAGYTFIGSMEFLMIRPNKEKAALNVRVYVKQ